MKKTLLKNIALVLISSMLTATLVVGGTVAYLQDTDSDVNVMTVGNVYIEQNEEQRVDPSKNGTLTDADIEDFEQAKPIYPYVDVNLNGAMRDDYEEITFPNGQTNKLFIGDNAIDKLVSVTNTGKTDAYVRTIVALEAPTDKIDLSFNPTDWTMDKTASSYSIEVDGVKYDLFVCVYKNVLKPGETTPYSLMQIILDGTATNEEAAAYGNTYDVLVLSQAVQVAGFANATTALDTAFGVVDSVSAAEWFGGVEIPNVLSDALGINKSTNTSGTFVLADDIETTGDASVSGATRYGYGYEYIIRSGVDYTLDLNGKTVSHKAINKNANHNALTYLFIANNAGTKLTIDGEGKVYCHNSEGYTCAIQGKDGTLVTVNGGDYEVDNGIAVWAGAGAHIVINGGSFVNGNATTDHELIYSSGGVIDIYGGFFYNTDGNYTLNVEDRNRATGFINVYGGTYVNFDPSTGGQDPNNIKVADGYKVVSETQANGDVWYTVVAE